MVDDANVLPGVTAAQKASALEENERTLGAQESVSEVVSEVFSGYVCHSIERGKVHPGDIAEAASLASIELPAAKYPLFDALGAEFVETGKLSKLQLEGVMYACQKHCEFAPDGKRAGFMIGDGAGVGKGRQISGIIIDNYVRGRRNAVWISSSGDLHRDAERDLSDLGSTIKVINSCPELDRETRAFGLSKEYQEGVLFTTYSTLVSKTQKLSRLDQIIRWFGGENAEGVVIFDECHKAKNFSATAETGSKVAAAVIEFQNRCPKARIVYASATGISEVGNMAYLSRLGFWGRGTPFKSADKFIESMKSRGVGFLEMLAMEMKASGKYVSRGLSFRQAEFETETIVLRPDQRKMYDDACDLMQMIRRACIEAVRRTRSDGKGVWGAYWSVHQRFFKLLCISMKVPAVVAKANQALAKGHCVVIGLQTTGEAQDNMAELKIGEDVTQFGFVSTTREMLINFLDTHFPTTYVDAADGSLGDNNVPPDWARENNWKQAGGVQRDSNDNSNEADVEYTGHYHTNAPRKVDEDLVAAKEELISKVVQLDLPPNFLDAMIDELGGPGNVAELTGRSGRVVRRGGKLVYEARGSTTSKKGTSISGDGDVVGVNIAEKNAFMNGEKYVAIISDAASTGISLHACQGVKNDRRRIHITIELPWSADKAIQQLGRTHRSNQTSGPIYVMCSTNIGGERRFVAAVARRLQSLGALTRGDRRAATGIDLSDGNLDSALGRQALKKMYEALVASESNLPNGLTIEGIMSHVSDQDLQDAPIATWHELKSELRSALVELGVQVGLRADGLSVEENELLREIGTGQKDIGDVRKFLNRLLGLNVRTQNIMFAYFAEALEAEIKLAKAEGKYSEGVSDIGGSSIDIDTQSSVILKDPYHGQTLMSTKIYIDRGISFERAVDIFQKGKRHERDGFYKMRRDMYGRAQVVLAMTKPGSRNLFLLWRPNTGASLFEMEYDELRQKYELVDAETAREPWEHVHSMTKNACMHGENCHIRHTMGACHAGQRTVTCTVISGAVVPTWGELERTLDRNAHKFNKADRGMRTVRVVGSDGRKVIGLRYPEELLAIVKEAVELQWAEKFTDPASLALLDEGADDDNMNAILGVEIEAPTPVDPSSMAKCFRKVKTLKDFFGGPKPSKTADVTMMATKNINTVDLTAPPRPFAKKPKTSLFDMTKYEAQKTKKTQTIRGESCCICSMAFPDEWSNERVNAHIDECLSKSTL
uniref:Helicase ATP-binding domain-containing protein n=1 Tax=Ostreococcus mediterraneus TaxID=1486918 RepID=A0A7S0KP95_9CHLO|mmetsp:Transcript_7303/g.26653  ORF Transcript_7303/g.26653 Transcript_7303/m.26653 type:complete len:1226 (+) Transcript_7303:110-3787(+)